MAGRKWTWVISTAAPASSPSRASAIAPTTSWLRPARRATYSRAWAASRGLPRIVPSTATSVSAPSVSGERTASALRRAFSSATATGAPWVSSSTPETRTSNAMPTCSRIARRCGER